MIIAIRISGVVENTQKVEETLFRMRLRKKYSAILLNETKENLQLLKKVRNHIAYGNLDQATLILLLEKRAQFINNKKIDSKDTGAKLISQDAQKKIDLELLGIKPFFRLHPPRGGIDSKIHFSQAKGVLGNNKEEINKLVKRML